MVERAAPMASGGFGRKRLGVGTGFAAGVGSTDRSDGTVAAATTGCGDGAAGSAITAQREPAAGGICYPLPPAICGSVVDAQLAGGGSRLLVGRRHLSDSPGGGQLPSERGGGAGRQPGPELHQCDSAQEKS